MLNRSGLFRSLFSPLMVRGVAGIGGDGGAPQPESSALKLSDNSSYLTLAGGGRLLLAQG